MKQLFKILVAAALLIASSCVKEYDDSALSGRIDDLDSRVRRLELLCQQMNTNISSLQTIVTALQNNDCITGVSPVVENGRTVGYTITFAKAQPITIYHGQYGNHVPVIGMKQDADGIYYWTLDGEWLLDGNGNKIKAQGADGKDGITPQLKIENGYWYISCDNGATWTQLCKATGDDGNDGSNGTDGTNGADGKSFFQDVTQDDNNVYFTLADGTVITVPKGSALSIAFDEDGLVVMSPDSMREIGYTVTSAAETVKVEVTSSADIKARVVVADESGLTGMIHIKTGASIDEYSKVIVFVSDGYKVIMRSIIFEEAGLQVDDNAVKNAPAEGGELTLEFLSNVECEAVIPQEAQSWISVVPATRAMEKQTITLKLEPNTGYYRSAAVTVQSLDGALKLEYQLEQEGDSGVEIDPENIPDNEIWYFTTDNQCLSIENSIEFNASVVSNTYNRGMGRIVFDQVCTSIGAFAFHSCSTLDRVILPHKLTLINNSAFSGCTSLVDVTIPSSVRSIGDAAFYHCASLKNIVIPEGVVSLGSDVFSCDVLGSVLETVYLPSTLERIEGYFAARCNSLKKFEGPCKLISSDGHSLIVDNKLLQYTSGASLTEYAIPNGVKVIENYSFYGATNLTALTIPATVEIIGSAAFEKTYNIERISGPNVLSDNRSYVYDKTLWYVADKGITEYTTPENIEVLAQGVFSDKQHLEKIIISDNVRSGNFYGYLFCGSHNLKTITISAQMRRLGYDPFGYYESNPYAPEKCKSLETIYLRAPIPPSIEHNEPERIASLFNNVTIYVPNESLGRYMASPAWLPYQDCFKAYDYGDLSEFYPDNYISSDYSQNGQVTTLQTATQGNGIDIVLMGDAYSDRQIADGTYRADMENLYENLFTEEPYKSFKNLFNVHYVNVVSASEGYEYGNTALGGFFGDGTLVGGNDATCFSYAQEAIGDERMDEALVIVAMNSDNYAGTCYMYYPASSPGTYGSGTSIAYFPKGGDATTFAQLLHHEACGHGFAKLADEYAYEYMGAAPGDYVSEIQSQQDGWGWWKNVDFTSDVNAVRWSRFIDDSRYANEGLGAYEGGLTYWTGVWRPTDYSIMRYNTGGFNAPSREAIYYRIHKLAYGDNWNYDYEEFVEWDARNRAASGVKRAPGFKPANYRPTHPPVVVKKSWKE